MVDKRDIVKRVPQEMIFENNVALKIQKNLLAYAKNIFAKILLFGTFPRRALESSAEVGAFERP